jgi:hypothetical protein
MFDFINFINLFSLLVIENIKKGIILFIRVPNHAESTCFYPKKMSTKNILF